MRALCLVLLLATPLGAQDNPPEKPPVANPPAPKVGQTRAGVLRKLADTTVHFEFRKAPLEDITEALARASGVRVRIGKKARKDLERRRFKIKYVADRRGDQVLADLSKAAALDYLVTHEGAYLDTRAVIRKLRKQLKLPGRATLPGPADVEKMLVTKALSLAAVEQPLSEVLQFLRAETGIKVVLLTGDKADGLVTLTATATPLGELLSRVCALHGLDWIRQGDVIVIDEAAKVAAQKKPAKQAD